MGCQDCRWNWSHRIDAYEIINRNKAINHRLFVPTNKTGKMILELIRKKILEKTSSLERFGMNDLTCDKEDALKLIHSLMEDDIGIFGGSVYKLELDELIQMYDNWYCNPLAGENRFAFNLRSKSEALEYIRKYLVYPGEKIIFPLVFTENVD